MRQCQRNKTGRGRISPTVHQAERLSSRSQHICASQRMGAVSRGGGDPRRWRVGPGHLSTRPHDRLTHGKFHRRRLGAIYSMDFRPKAVFSPLERDDACAAVENLRTMECIDAQRVAMIGGSHGGHHSSRITARCDLSCAIPCAPAALDMIEVDCFQTPPNKPTRSSIP